ncbi:hypothetical protein [Halonotius pteroides]|uniref:Uncharacterized protein n=1 Tax=Halonotius pteroides TaxID=268735 RepID=A0A3A6Q834_9EURY|nr:hypothetical protein [Halonotius pteroides]RJX47820.1 hypothetical protein DP106_13990 [Halonotius pteroides]
MEEAEENQNVIAVPLSEKRHPEDAPVMMDFAINKINWELLQQRMDEYGFSAKARAARYFINIGMHSIAENDPRNSSSETENTQSTSTESVGIENFVPEGKENALNIKDDELVEAIRNNILDIVDDNPELQRDGLEVYR